MARKPPTVFVGNIPYDATEEQLKEKFSEAGPVVSFRLVFDRDTGKPKGFGFCEYLDEESAQCAMRNLHNTEFGGRHLRVDYQGEGSKEPGMMGGPPGSGDGRMLAPPGGMTATQQPSSNVQVTPEMAQKHVLDTIHTMDEGKVIELLAQFKSYAKVMPDEARYLLLQNPQLSYALLQGALRTGVLDKSQADDMITADVALETPSMGPHGSSMSSPGLAGQSHMMHPRPLMPGMLPSTMLPRPFSPGMGMGPMQQMAGFPAGIVPHQGMFIRPGMMPPMMPGGMPMPGMPMQQQQQQQQHQHQMGMRPQMQQQSQAGSNQLAGLTDEKRREYLELVLSLTLDDISQLPPEQRDSMMILRREAEALRLQGR